MIKNNGMTYSDIMDSYCLVEGDKLSFRGTAIPTETGERRDCLLVITCTDIECDNIIYWVDTEEEIADILNDNFEYIDWWKITRYDAELDTFVCTEAEGKQY